MAAGRLVEVTGREDTAALTMAVRLILDAQRAGEQAAWIAPSEGLFFPPDLVANGVDLRALVVVCVPDGTAGARAADRLVRSGSFGAVVVDVGPVPRIPPPLLARLASLAQRHHTALVFLTQGGVPGHPGAPSVNTAHDGASSLGSLISLRVRARRQRIAAGRFRCWLEVLKDKRRGPTWRYDEVCRGAPGMR
ncbi:MAG: recombinase A [Armatimonadota bacterium]|nr:recombinase A [Armatimonadota bacterium]MDR7497730.1 recombinase A [Armatimonadota bacterium]MDR7512827.1 recombinase A [Armatimonadota bacterium]